MTLAEAIAKHLEEAGCTHAFGIVGGGNVTLFDALAKRMQVVCCHHEQAAAMAATYYFRTCGRLAPVLVTSGAGSANAVTGVMAAYMDSIPLLVLSGNEKAAALRGDTRILGVQGYDSTELARGFTKHAERIFGAAAGLTILREGIGRALAPRRGPVWLDIPQDVQKMEMGALRAVA